MLKKAGRNRGAPTETVPLLRRRRARGLSYVLPCFIFLSVITIFPITYSLYLGFSRYQLQLGAPPEWVSFGNYIEGLTDPKFINSVVVLLKVMGMGLAAEFLIGFGLALLLNAEFRGKTVAITLLTAPAVIAPSVAALMFRILYHPQYGNINSFLSWLFGQQIMIRWLDADLALYSVTAVDVYRATAFVMLVMLAGLSSISPTLYECAKCEGASALQGFRMITLPLMKWHIVMVLLIRLIDLAKFFGIPYILTGGGPADVTKTVNIYIFEAGLQAFRVGYGSALSIMLLIGVLILTIAFIQAMGKRG
jgi:multiple sugar transport system permease protein